MRFIFCFLPRSGTTREDLHWNRLPWAGILEAIGHWGFIMKKM
jgi:hypothetical protein